jgi:hypothetical protein
MDGRSLDDELAAQLAMSPECTLCLQLLAMRNHLVDDELAAQLTMPTECTLCLQLLAMHNHLEATEPILYRL